MIMISLDYSYDTKEYVKSERVELPAEEPTRSIRGSKRVVERYLQAETTSLTSEKPVSEARPVDFPTPLMSKMSAGKPQSDKLRAIPLIRA